MRTEPDWMEAILHEERRGELLAAVDLAERALEEHPGSSALAHRGVLALARAGATHRAAERFGVLGLEAVDDPETAALGARITKDLALAAGGAERVALARAARDRYLAIHARSPGYYPAVNAATLSMLAGDEDGVRASARQALVLADGTYYGAATAAEAHLLLGDVAAAAIAVVAAAARHGGDHTALATTRRQLRLVCELRGVDPSVLDPLAGPAVVHFCGHRTGFDEASVAAQVAAVVAAERPGFAYGALAGGADVLWAEALLAAGAELHVVLPVEAAAFSEASVGPAWADRFAACLAAATDVRFATEDASLGDDVLFGYGAQLAMGLALLRARYLDAPVAQLAIWDGQAPTGPAGTAADVAVWQQRGERLVVVSPGTRADTPVAPGADRPERVVRALLFSDVADFSRINDAQTPAFARHVLGALAEVLKRFGVLHANSWGDALYVVLGNAMDAAACALALQDAVAALDLTALGLPPIGVRLAVHLGPVHPVDDPVIGRAAFMGSHVSRTARLEPVTPPGEVYVTEAFAAALELAGEARFACDYVGHMPAAKDHGRMRMYRLRRR